MMFPEKDNEMTMTELINIRLPEDGENALAYCLSLSDRHIAYGSTLSVGDTYAAVLNYGSDVSDIFLPGKYTLGRSALKKAALLYGEDYFCCDVCYVDIKPTTGLSWGVSDGISFIDGEGKAAAIGLNGSYGYRITNPVIFINKVFGDVKSLTQKRFTEQLESLIAAGITGIFRELNADPDTLCSEKKAAAAFAGKKLNDELKEYGFVLIGFSIDDVFCSEPATEDTDLTNPVQPNTSDDTVQKDEQPAETEDEAAISEQTEQNNADTESAADSTEQELTQTTENTISGVLAFGPFGNPAPQENSSDAEPENIADEQELTASEQPEEETQTEGAAKETSEMESDEKPEEVIDSVQSVSDDMDNQPDSAEQTIESDDILFDEDAVFAAADAFAGVQHTTEQPVYEAVQNSADFAENKNTIEDIEMPAEENAEDSFDFKLEISDAESDYFDYDNITLNAEGEENSSEDEEFAVDENEAILSGGHIRLNSQSDWSDEDDFSIFIDCPNCGKPVIRGITCPECGTYID